MVVFRLLFGLILLTGFMCESAAQVPGYLGKRFVLQVEGLSSPTVSHPSANNKAFLQTGRFRDGNGWLGINARFSLEANYVITRQGVLSLSYDRQRTGMQTHAFNASNLRDEQLYRLQGQAFTVGWKTYSKKKGALAPFGAYTGIHLTYMQMNGELLESWRGGDPVANAIEFYGVDPQKGYLLAGLEFGTNYILKDRLVINLSGQINSPMNLFRVLSWVAGTDYLGNPTTIADRNQAIFEQSVFGRITGQSLFLMQVGVGYLLF